MLLNCGVVEDSWESLRLQRRSNQSILKEISPEYSLEGLMLKLKLQYFGHLIRRTGSLEKTLMLGKDWGQEEKGTTVDEIVGWHHRLNGHEFEQASEVGVGQGGLVCCSPWDHTELDVTEWLNWLTNEGGCKRHQECLSTERRPLKMKPSRTLWGRPKYKSLSMSLVSCFFGKILHHLELPWIPYSRFKHLLIREVRECRNKGKAIKKL